MKVFKRKQIVVLSLVLMIIVAGYLQYSYKRSSVAVDGKETGKMGEAVYVENNSTDSQDQVANTVKDKNTEAVKDTKTSKAVNASKQANDYFAQAKLDREVTRSKDTDSLKTIVDDKNIAKDTKAKAYEQMMRIVSNAEKEMKIETLVKEKGFNDTVALFGDDGSVDIVVKAPSLTSSQVAQIVDITSRQANVDISKIHIRNIF